MNNKCPLCAHPAYIGMTNCECENAACQNFVSRPAEPTPSNEIPGSGGYSYWHPDVLSGQLGQHAAHWAQKCLDMGGAQDAHVISDVWEPCVADGQVIGWKLIGPKLPPTSFKELAKLSDALNRLNEAEVFRRGNT